MSEIGKPVQATFESIRQGLDPAYSYMFFERIAKSGRAAEFHEVMEALRLLGLVVYERRLFLDGSRGRLILMVKLEAGSAYGIMQDLLAIGLPEDITFFAYGSHNVS